MSHPAYASGTDATVNGTPHPAGSVLVMEDRVVIRDLAIEEPVVWNAAKMAARPDMWIRHCIINGVVSEYVLEQSMKLADTTREITILTDILTDWFMGMSAIPRHGNDLDAIAARDFKRRADEQLLAVIASLRALSEDVAK